MTVEDLNEKNKKKENLKNEKKKSFNFSNEKNFVILLNNINILQEESFDISNEFSKVYFYN